MPLLEFLLPSVIMYYQVLSFYRYDNLNNGVLYIAACFVNQLKGHRIRPQMTLDVMPNSPFVSQANTRQFGRRI